MAKFTMEITTSEKDPKFIKNNILKVAQSLIQQFQHDTESGKVSTTKGVVETSGSFEITEGVE